MNVLLNELQKDILAFQVATNSTPKVITLPKWRMAELYSIIKEFNGSCVEADEKEVQIFGVPVWFWKRDYIEIK